MATAMADLQKHSGIINPGNQCYFNSLIQALASCKSIFIILCRNKMIDDLLLDTILEHDLLTGRIADIKAKCRALIGKAATPLIKQICIKLHDDLLNVFIYLNWITATKALWRNTSGGAITIDTLVATLKTSVLSHMISELFSGAQCDPHEALIFILELFHKYMGGKLHDGDIPQLGDEIPQEIRELYMVQFKKEYGACYSPLIRHFHNSYLTLIHCTACGHNAHNISPLSVLDISMPIAATCTLEDCIRSYFADESISGYVCDKCHARERVIMKKSMLVMADTLIIEMKRFIHRPGHILKNCGKLVYPACIDIAPYSYEAALGCKYVLNAVIVHVGGGTGNGHYYACVKKCTTGQWYMCNDSHTRPITLDAAVGEYGAYLLFYTRKQTISGI
jgi:ubiquitin C-terminal hydrolase